MAIAPPPGFQEVPSQNAEAPLPPPPAGFSLVTPGRPVPDVLRPMARTPDYDMMGYAAKYGIPDQSKGQHLTDEFKLPNHMTFSKESKYSTPEKEGGEWRQEGGKWHFYASPFNLSQHPAEDLKYYFEKREPDAVLHLPGEGQPAKPARPTGPGSPAGPYEYANMAFPGASADPTKPMPMQKGQKLTGPDYAIGTAAETFYKQAFSKPVETVGSGIELAGDWLERLNASGGKATNPVTSAIGQGMSTVFKSVKALGTNIREYQESGNRLADLELSAAGIDPKSKWSQGGAMAGEGGAMLYKYGNSFGLGMAMLESGVDSAARTNREGFTPDRALAKGILSAATIATVTGIPGGSAAAKSIAVLLAKHASRAVAEGTGFVALDALVNKMVLDKDMTKEEFQDTWIKSVMMMVALKAMHTGRETFEVAKAKNVAKQYTSWHEAENVLKGKIQEKHQTLYDPDAPLANRQQAEKNIRQAWRDLGALDYAKKAGMKFTGKGETVDPMKEIADALEEIPERTFKGRRKGTLETRKQSVEADVQEALKATAPRKVMGTTRPKRTTEDMLADMEVPTPMEEANRRQEADQRRQAIPADQIREALPPDQQAAFDAEMAPVQQKAQQAETNLQGIQRDYDAVLKKAKNKAYAKKGNKAPNDSDIHWVLTHDAPIIAALRGIQARHEASMSTHDAIAQEKQAVEDRWRSNLNPQPKEVQDAVQEPSPAPEIPRDGSGRGNVPEGGQGVGQGQQGQEAPREGQVQAQGQVQGQVQAVAPPAADYTEGMDLGNPPAPRVEPAGGVPTPVPPQAAQVAPKEVTAPAPPKTPVEVKTTPAPAAPVAGEKKLTDGSPAPAVLHGYPTVGFTYQIPKKDMTLDPKRFQFRTRPSEGVAGAKVYNPALAHDYIGWVDEQGRLCIVDGHHQFALAPANEILPVKFIRAKDADAAMVYGAMKNIAEGTATPIDAARLFRQKSMTMEDIENAGIPLKKSMVADGIALSRLSDRWFELAASDANWEKAGIVVGKSLDPSLHDVLLNVLSSGTKGKGPAKIDLNPEYIKNLCDGIKASQISATESGGMFSEAELNSNIKERAAIQADVIGSIRADKTLMERSKRKTSAAKLEKAGVAPGGIDTGLADELGEEARRLLFLFENEKNTPGEISDAIDELAGRLQTAKSTKDARSIREEAIPKIRGLLETTLSRGKSEHPSAGKGHDEPAKVEEAARVEVDADPGASLFDLGEVETVKPKPEEPAPDTASAGIFTDATQTRLPWAPDTQDTLKILPESEVKPVKVDYEAGLDLGEAKPEPAKVEAKPAEAPQPGKTLRSKPKPGPKAEVKPTPGEAPKKTLRSKAKAPEKAPEPAEAPLVGKGRRDFMNGDLVEYTGATQEKHGTTLHEFTYLEGHQKGKTGWQTEQVFQKSKEPAKPKVEPKSGTKPKSAREEILGKFAETARQQRGTAEEAMRKVRTAYVGGVLNPVVEHGGDLIHRMTEEAMQEDAGYRYVQDKVGMLIDDLKPRPNRISFAQEVKDNIRSNAEYGGKDPVEFLQAVHNALDEYGKAHAALPAYNEAQRTAKEITQAIAEQDWGAALKGLKKLESHLGSKEEWVKYAHEGVPAEGTPAEPAKPAAKPKTPAQIAKEEGRARNHQAIEKQFPGDENSGLRNWLYKKGALDGEHTESYLNKLAEHYRKANKPKTDAEVDQAITEVAAKEQDPAALVEEMDTYGGGERGAMIITPSEPKGASIIPPPGQKGRNMLSRAFFRIVNGMTKAVTEPLQPFRHIGEDPFWVAAKALDENNQLQHFYEGGKVLPRIAYSIINPELPKPIRDIRRTRAGQYFRSPHNIEDPVLGIGKGFTNDRLPADNHRLMLQVAGVETAADILSPIRDASPMVKRKMKPTVEKILSIGSELQPLEHKHAQLEKDLRKVEEAAAKRIASAAEAKEIEKALRTGSPGDRSKRVSAGSEKALLNAMDQAKTTPTVIKAQEAMDAWMKEHGAKYEQLKKDLKDHYKKADELVQELAGKHADVRVALLAEIPKDGEIPHWLDKISTTVDKEVAGQVQTMMETYKEALKEMGIPTLENPYLTHLLRPFIDAERFGTAEGQQHIREVLAFHKRQGVMNLFPTVHGSLAYYIPVVSKKLAYQPLLNKWAKNPYLKEGSGMYAPRYGAWLNEQIRELEYPKKPEVYESILQGVKTAEILKTIAFSPRVAVKHLTGKLPNLLGYHHTWLLPAGKDLARLYAEKAVNRPLIAKAVKNLGWDPTNAKQAQLLAANLMATKTISRMLREDPYIADYERTLDRPTTWVLGKVMTLAGQPVAAVEAFENGMNMMASFRRGSAAGMTAQEQVRATISTILDFNYRGGGDAARYLKSPLMNAGVMFTMTPAKGLELHEKILMRGLRGEKDVFGSDETAHLIRHIVAIGAVGLMAQKYGHDIFKTMFHPPVVNLTWAGNAVKALWYGVHGQKMKAIQSAAKMKGDWRGAASLSPVLSLGTDFFDIIMAVATGDVNKAVANVSSLKQRKVLAGGKLPRGYEDRLHYLTDSPTDLEKKRREQKSLIKGMPFVQQSLRKK